MTPNLSRRQLDDAYNKKKKMIYLGTLFVLCYLIVLSLFGEVNLPHYFSMKKAYDQMKDEINQLKIENTHLTKQTEALRSDPAQIESLAREELGLAKKGEIIYEFPKSPPSSSKP